MRGFLKQQLGIVAVLPQGAMCDAALAFPWEVIRKFGLQLPTVTVNSTD